MRAPVRDTSADVRTRSVFRFVVVATGGLFLDPALTGVLTPAWSYLFGAPVPDDAFTPEVSSFAPTAVLPSASSAAACTTAPSASSPFSVKLYSSPNFFTFGFAYDWCITGGKWRCSGEDHFSALKAPRHRERCALLAAWSVSQLPALSKPVVEGRFEIQYGVTSETPDYVPIIGTPRPDSRVCYLLGCNALGQSILTYAATLVPGILGFRSLDKFQKQALDLMSIRRFALLPVVQGTAELRTDSSTQATTTPASISAKL